MAYNGIIAWTSDEKNYDKGIKIFWQEEDKPMYMLL